MKKVIYTILSITMLTACKKETTQANNTNNSNNNTNTCIDNPNINFSSIGTPVGKFGDCIKDIDGNSYKTVTIGTQTWMAENLKVSKYNDGSIITNETDSMKWSKLTTGAWVYNNNDTLNNIKYGKLYNWYVVSLKTNGNKNVCPTGWHVPTDTEWTVLIDYLGGKTVAGGKMKEVGTKSWGNQNSSATNTSLFTGLPGGDLKNGHFDKIGEFGIWWSSSETEYNSEVVWKHYLNGGGDFANRNSDSKVCGYSIRCIKD